MAHRFLKKYPRSLIKRPTEIKQSFKYLLVMDFEATCIEWEKLKPQEIIEFPCVAVSTKSWQIENTFHEYVKPKVHPNLSPFCTKLTGIIQEMVENQPYFPEVFDKFIKWLEENKYMKDDNKAAFVTCGLWDLRIMLPEQCKLENIPIPKYFEKWINLKETFYDATGCYPRSMTDMISFFQLPLEGRLHSGIDDVKNMVRIIQSLYIKHNAQFKINTAPEIILKYLQNNYKIPQKV